MYNKQVQVPIILTLCTMGAYIVLGALVFAYIEGWKLSDAIYFSFVTLTTIGFGDLTPSIGGKGEGKDQFVEKLVLILLQTSRCTRC